MYCSDVESPTCFVLKACFVMDSINRITYMVRWCYLEQEYACTFRIPNRQYKFNSSPTITIILCILIENSVPFMMLLSVPSGSSVSLLFKTSVVRSITYLANIFLEMFFISTKAISTMARPNEIMAGFNIQSCRLKAI